jgi:osomolarity two-component system sensor histidine kinase NIK1
MLGDREKCIQAQMDEYLSKPLKQNHLIQTILKCATLGGALLEKGRDVRQSAKDGSSSNASTSSTSAAPVAPQPTQSNALALTRPSLEPRAFTTTGPITHGSLESPALITADQDDPLQRVSQVPEFRRRQMSEG